MIVLIRINSKNTMGNPPLGLLYVGDALKKAGYEVKVYHICEDDTYGYVKEIKSLNPLWIGFSVNTGWSMKAGLEMASELKRGIAVPIAWGNAHPSLLPEQCLREKAIDFVVMGEGEATSVELSDAIVRNDGLERVKGLAYRDKNGRAIINEERELIDSLDKYSMDWSLLDPEQYVFTAPQFGMQRAFQFITSRGCPHQCGFCYNLRFNKRRWRAHSEDYVVEQLLRLKRELNLDGIRFWDDNFFTDKRRAFNIVERVGLPYTAEVRVDYINEAFAKKLHETKCRMVLLGFESGSDRVLALIQKGIDKDRSMRALEIMNQYPEISIHPSFIVGFPTETPEEYKETVDLFAEMIRKRPNFWFVRLGLYVPYPGCDLYELAIQQGFKPPETLEEWDRLIWDTSTEKAVTCTDWLKGKETLREDEEYLNLLRNVTESRLPLGFLADIIYRRIRHRYYGFPVERHSMKVLQLLKDNLKRYGQSIVQGIKSLKGVCSFSVKSSA